MNMPRVLPEPPAALRVDADGVIRVGSSRVTLDTVIGAFRNGCTVEQIVIKYLSLDLAGIDAAITYYSSNREQIDAYLIAREAEACAARDEVELRQPTTGIRESLLARKRPAW